MEEKASSKIRYSMRISAVMCGRALSPALELSCCDEPEFLRLFELCPIYLHTGDFPGQPPVPAGWGLRCTFAGGVLTLVADFEPGFLKVALDASKTAFNDLYLSPVITALEWEVFDGIIRIKKAEVPRILVRTGAVYSDAKKAEMLPMEALNT